MSLMMPLSRLNKGTTEVIFVVTHQQNKERLNFIPQKTNTVGNEKKQQVHRKILCAVTKMHKHDNFKRSDNLIKRSEHVNTKQFYYLKRTHNII